MQHEKSNNENMHKNSITVQSSMQMDNGLYIGWTRADINPLVPDVH